MRSSVYTRAIALKPYITSVSCSYTDTTDTPESSDSGLVVPQDSVKQEPSPPPPPLAPTEEPQSQILSSLRLENQLLRSEVASLNGEMASVIQRAKDLQDGKTLGSDTHAFLSIYHFSVSRNKWFCLLQN